MACSTRRGPFASERLTKKVEAQEGSEKKQVIRTWSRHSTIFPNFIGRTFTICDGRKYAPIYVTEDMIGHKSGEFAPTRTFKGRAADDKKARR